jgi:hypothetical protein
MVQATDYLPWGPFRLKRKHFAADACTAYCKCEEVERCHIQATWALSGHLSLLRTARRIVYKNLANMVAPLLRCRNGYSYEVSQNSYGICEHFGFKCILLERRWLSGSVVGWDAMLQPVRSWFRFSMRSLDFLNLINLSSRTMTLAFTQLLTEMSTRYLPGGGGGGKCGRRVRPCA